ncbi:hypothetical protein EYF80_017636 [Liparis tanakae]|uniref:Uncharacterized protein n=1 Tax=Liparis tanakae TaxID=230148 RepID=A0A4Z2I2P3_9TELE|nr:hypothetical protein EYF80_017636 [Liparis tanakae]
MLPVEEVALCRGEVAGEAVQGQVALLPALLGSLVGLDELQAGLLTHLEVTELLVAGELHQQKVDLRTCAKVVEDLDELLHGDSLVSSDRSFVFRVIFNSRFVIESEATHPLPDSLKLFEPVLDFAGADPGVHALYQPNGQLQADPFLRVFLSVRVRRRGEQLLQPTQTEAVLTAGEHVQGMFPILHQIPAQSLEARVQQVVTQVNTGVGSDFLQLNPLNLKRVNEVVNR